MSGPLWQALRDALSRLGEDGRPIDFWLRDDDLVAPSLALDRLIAVAGNVPLALAVIPALAEPALVERLNPLPGVTVLQHGFSHANHAASGKKCELGSDRPLSVVLGELAEGRQRLGMFAQVADILVPPWNRIGDEVVAGLPALGFRALSVYGDRAAPADRDAGGDGSGGGDLLRLNTHVDPIDWHGTRGFRGEEAVLGELMARLARLQDGAAERDEPTGILTHHLVHDDAGFDFLANLLPAITEHAACRWQSAQTLLGLEVTR